MNRRQFLLHNRLGLVFAAGLLSACGVANFVNDPGPPPPFVSKLPPAELGLQGASTIMAESCAGPYDLLLRDPNGDRATARETESVSPTLPSGVSLFEDSQCNHPLAELSVPAGETFRRFYLKALQPISAGELRFESSRISETRFDLVAVREPSPELRLSLFDRPLGDAIFLLMAGTPVSKDYQLRLMNTGSSSLRLIGPGSKNLMAPFSYVGGSFPGSGGTCAAGTNLAPGVACTLNIQFNHDQIGVFTGSFDFRAETDSNSQVFEFDLSVETSPQPVPVKLAQSFATAPVACVIFNDKTMTCLGDNSNGSLGLGHTGNKGEASHLKAAANAEPVANLSDVSQAAITGNGSVCAVKTDGSLRCWGYNSGGGALGAENMNPRGANLSDVNSGWVNVNLGTGRTVRRITAGQDHFCTLLDDTSVKCWGQNSNGQLGVSSGAYTSIGFFAGQMGNNLSSVSLAMGTVSDVVAATYSTCALSSTGLVKCWGSGIAGALGRGNTTDYGKNPGTEMGSNLPYVSLGTNLKALKLSGGAGFFCALLERSTDKKKLVKCWGLNTSYALGLADTNNRGDQANEMGDNLPALSFGTDQYGNLFEPADIIAGEKSACAISDLKVVKCWGDNTNGRLASFWISSDLPLQNPAAINQVLLTGSKPRAIVPMLQGFCALLENSSVKCWGNINLGLREVGGSTLRTGSSSAAGSEELPFNRQKFLEFMRVGPLATCVQWRGPMMSCMGQVSPAHFYHGSPLSPLALVSSVLPPAANAESLDFQMGDQFICAISSSNQVYCTGRDLDGQLGLNLSSNTLTSTLLLPVNLGTGVGALTLAVGGLHSCVITNLGQVKCWGRNSAGQLGLDNTTSRGGSIAGMGDNLPVVNLGQTAMELALGENHSCARLQDGSLKCWGQNSSGELGQGDTDNRGDTSGEMASLSSISLGSGRTVKSLSAGANHTCAILDNDTLKCWGNNQYGQLGLGDTDNRGDDPGEMGDSLPTVNLGTNLFPVKVAAAKNFTCVIAKNSTTHVLYVKCFGLGPYLGLGGTADKGKNPGEMGDNLPSLPFGGGFTHAVDLRTHPMASHMCAIMRNRFDPNTPTNTLKCWGASEIGQTGIEMLPGGSLIIGDEANEVTQLGLVSGPNVTLMRNRTADYNVPGQYQFKVPAGIEKLRLNVWGAGGGGGFSPFANQTSYGGNSGAMSFGEIKVTPGTSFNVTVGLGGNGGNPALTNGSVGAAGSASSFIGEHAGRPVTIVANGGGGGVGYFSTTSPATGAVGGAQNYPGQLTSSMPWHYAGACSPYGGGQRGSGASFNEMIALDGRFPGGGGSAIHDPSVLISNYHFGGRGAPGRVLVEMIEDETVLSAPSAPDLTALNAQIFRGPGSYIYTVAEGVARLRVQIWGGGGSGGASRDGLKAACGGGAGGFIEYSFSVKTGDRLDLRVGGGGAFTDAEVVNQSGNPGQDSFLRGPKNLFLKASGGQGGASRFDLGSGPVCTGGSALYSQGGGTSYDLGLYKIEDPATRLPTSSAGEAGVATADVPGYNGGRGGNSASGGSGGVGGTDSIPCVIASAGQSPGGGGGGSARQNNCYLGQYRRGGAGAPGEIRIYIEN